MQTIEKIAVENGGQMLQREKKWRKEIQVLRSSSKNLENRVVALPRIKKKAAVGR